MVCLCWSWVSIHNLCILYLAVNWGFFFFFFWFGFILADLKKASSSNAAKSNLPKSGLRPPGYSRLPAAKLAAFGFVRSSSVSSVSSTQSADSAQPEPSRLANRKWGGWAGGRCCCSQTGLTSRAWISTCTQDCNFCVHKVRIWVDYPTLPWLGL